jgi:hypothetical protein
MGSTCEENQGTRKGGCSLGQTDGSNGTEVTEPHNLILRAGAGPEATLERHGTAFV